MARRHGDRPAVAIKTIMNDLSGGFRGPGHHAHGFRIRFQHDVDIRRIHGALIVRIVAGDRLQEDRFRQAHPSSSANFSAGMSLPRATPAMSGMMASTSEIPCSLKNCWIVLAITHL